ncbi:MAG: 54S ribosomal protein, mitochondrial [Pycnora praestabilis]|nr:MAG: 54S ribosomal protein, mitochondrial [Pycnora praestabilis]
MASKSLSTSLRNVRQLDSGLLKDSLRQCLAPRLSRSMATETQLVGQDMVSPWTNAHLIPLAPQVPTTIYKFPTMEPLRFESYPSTHLHLPLRRDILHRAVIYEGDATRQGTASTKWRSDVHGSNRKVRPQKGTGRARLGNKKSPMLRGGGVAFGPHPRDFSTGLPKKIYDLAWRTALSYRYRKGELIVVEDGMDIEFPKTRYIKQIFDTNHWGNSDGRSLFIAGTFRKNLFRAVRHAEEDGKVLMEKDVDVKDLLELGRIVIEKRALDSILKNHQSDLMRERPAMAGF